MKKIKSTYLFLAAGLFFASCSNDDTKVTFLGGAAPTLTPSSTTALVLAKANENYSAIQFSWTNPAYSFSNGASTQDVFYSLQIDTTGSNFSNPKMVSIAYTNDVSHTFTVKELNTTLSGLELPDNMVHNFEFRIKATLANGNSPQYSDVTKVKITTYLDVVYPVPAKLYIVGDATPSGWTNDPAPGKPDASQTFTKVNTYLFQINSLALSANQFLFIPVAGDWTHKYAFDAPGATNNTSGDFFKPDAASNFQAPAAGNYKITVNFKTGKYTLDKI